MSNTGFFSKVPKYSQREVDFILRNLELDGYEVTTPNDERYLLCFTHIDHKINIFGKIYFNPKFCLVPDGLISWIKDDLRAALWFYSFLIIRENRELTIKIWYAVFSKDLILSFDSDHVNGDPEGYACRDFGLFIKNRMIKEAIPLYRRFKTGNKNLSWLDRKDQEQMDWAMDYLREKELLINAPIFLPLNTKECYAQICASLDALDLHPDLEQKIIDSQNTKAKDSDESSQNINQGVVPQVSHLNPTNHTIVDTSRKNVGLANNTFIRQTHKESYETLFGKNYEGSDAKKDLLKKMRTAWNQKVFRDKKPVKAEKQIKLPREYEKKVKNIAEANGQDIVICLKEIIDQKYNNIKSKN